MSLELQRGAVLGRYELLVRIGRGGMASVWVARGRPDPDGPEQLVAIKAMLPDLAENLEFRSMFLDEGKIVGSIDHPNVVRIFEVAEDRGVLFLAMEWVEGDSLHALIAEANKRRPIPPEVAVRMIANTASGLHAAHELRGWNGERQGVVHCDVSPHNILIGLDGGVKLVDFGVAAAMNQLNEDDEAMIRGKFGYMSPEQAQAKPLDRRSDVFSLGIVLFELTTGYRLFRGRDDRHTLDLVTWGKIPKPSRVVSDYPPRLEQIVMRTLEREIEKRYQTADELRSALEAYLVEERILVPSAGVKGLLRRVLGSRIDERRTQIRTAIRALDGSIPAIKLVSDGNIAESSLPEDDAGTSVSVKVGPEGDAHAREQLSPLTGVGAARLPTDSLLGTHSVSQITRPRPRSYSLLWTGAFLGLFAAAVAVLIVTTRKREPTVTEAPIPRARAATASRAIQTPVNGTDPPAAEEPGEPKQTTSIESLPPERLPLRRKPSVPGRPPPEKPKPQKLEEPEASKPANEKRPNENNQEDRVNRIAETVTLTDDPQAPPPEPDPTETTQPGDERDPGGSE